MISARNSPAGLMATLLLCGCYYGDLDVHGKWCSNRPGNLRECPQGYICVEHPKSKTELEGFCIEAGTAVPCNPGATFCNEAHNWVEKCQKDGYSTEVDVACNDLSLTCNPDTALCAYSCEDDDLDCPQDEGEQTCDVGTKLCRPYEECLDRYPYCASTPEQDLTVPSMDCLGTEYIPPDPDPATCKLTGRVYMFPIKNSVDTVGLEVVLRPAGDLDTEITRTTVYKTPCVTTAGDCGNYDISNVDTNKIYDMEIRMPDGWTGAEVKRTIHAGIAIRSNRLENDTFPLSLNAMAASTYESYTSGLIENYDHEIRGLLIGRVLDCGTSDGKERYPLENVKVGLAVPPVAPGRIYYFPKADVLAPDPNLDATTEKGYYAVVGVPACRNQVEFAARQVSRLDLGRVSFTMRESVAVIIDSPHPLDLYIP